MSYVIQNFYDSNKKISFTPRFKLFLILNNLEKFLIFIKMNTFLYMTNKINFFNLNYLFLFFKYFFSTYYLKLLSQTNLTLSGAYTNNLTKSCIFYVFFSLFHYLKNSNVSLQNKTFQNNIIYNLYFLPIKTINIRINNTFYKNIFFYFMLISPFLWYQHTSNLKFYLNFIFVNYTLKISRFYNGHFLRIYNY